MHPDATGVTPPRAGTLLVRRLFVGTPNASSKAMTPGPIERFMTEDHVRLDRMLEGIDADPDTLELALYDAFRRGLFRHIGQEEKILLPFARAKRDGVPLAMASTMRAEHGEIVKLLATSMPTRDLCDQLRVKLGKHNALEEGEHGLYARCDALAGTEATGVVARLRAAPEVPLARPCHA